MSTSHNPDIIAFIDKLADTGSDYRMEEMEALHTDDLGFLVLRPNGEVARFSKSEMLGQLRSRRDAGEPPLLTEKRILHIEEHGEDATAVLFRPMSAQADPAMHELRLKKIAGNWPVCGVTVTPWPDLAKAKGFLAPRV